MTDEGRVPRRCSDSSNVLRKFDHILTHTAPTRDYDSCLLQAIQRTAPKFRAVNKMG